MADRLDVLLGILLDKAAQKDVERGLSNIEQALGKLDDAQLYRLSLELESVGKITQEIEEHFAQARQEAERLSTSAGKLAGVSAGVFAAGTAIVAGAALAARNYAKFVEDAGIQGDETADRWVAASKRVKNAQLNLGEDAAQALLPVYEKLATLAEQVAGFANAHPELVSAAINTGAVVAVVGAIGLAVSKGIRLVADFKYLAATTEYSLATTRFQNSVREFLAGEFLGGALGGASPFALNKAGRPYDIKTGRFVSQAAYEASLATGSAGGGATSAFGKAAKAIGAVTLIATSVFLGAEVGNALANAIRKLIDPDAKEFTLNETLFYGGVRALEALDQRWIEFLHNAGLASDEAFNRANQFLTKTDQWAGKVLGITELQQQQAEQQEAALRDFQKEANLAQATQSYIQYRQQEAQAEQQYMEQRAQIVEQGAALLAQIEANYTQQRAQLVQQFASSNAQAVSNFNYQRAQAEEQFNRSEARALEEYNRNRAEARENYQDEERRSAEDHQREMQRLEEESLARQSDLVAARDALGLVKERRDLARRQRDAEEDYSVERKRRRQDFRQRLQDMDEQFQQERQRRREDFDYQQAQAEEQFARQQAQAKQQYEERLKQLDEQHRQEMEKARQQTAEKLRELQLEYRQEQITRRNAFFDILRDLDASLLNEQEIRLAYYQRMQQDLINFLDNTANAGSNLPGYQSGGYAIEGPIRTHRGEWVANRETTNALERMVGGRLTQEGVRSLMRGGGVTYQDNRRFNSRLSVADRREIAEDTKRLILETQAEILR